MVENRLHLIIEDNGIGFDLESQSKECNGFGIIGMQNRAISFGGIFEINSQPGHGTSILVETPVKKGLKLNMQETHRSG